MKYLCVLLLLLAAYGSTAQSRQLRIGTYNLRYDNEADRNQGNGWQQRCPVISRLIRFYSFDILGTQEGLNHQLLALKDSLHGYDFTGVGRDDGKEKGEYAAIFYNTARFLLSAHGSFWLAPDTARPVKGWDAALPRICTWALFKERSTGFTFYCFNLHMDHIGVTARRESARLVLDVIRKKAGKIPVVLMGDFNAAQQDEPYHLISNSGILQDAYSLSPIKWATTGTFNGFDATRCSNDRIDYIFLTAGLHAGSYAILNNTYSDCSTAGTGAIKFPSDHFPVMVVADY